MNDERRPPLTFEFFPDVPTFTLTSTSISDGATLSARQVADSMGQSGENRSPQLAWSGFPAETKSFAVTIHDPDAPTGSGFWHWLVVDLAPHVHELAEGAGSSDGRALPAGAVQVRNDTGAPGYVGAAPPPGPAHRYVTVVHALDIDSLEIDADTTPAVVGFNLRFHDLARAQIVPIFAA